MIALGYCRVSTDKQGERGYGLKSQRDAIEAEIKRRDWTQGQIFVDVASGGSRAHRPQFDAAIETLRAGDAQVLVVAKLDRLSRSLLDFALLMAQSKREGWSVAALDIGIDTSTPNGELIVNIIMALAQWERRIISQRTKDALVVVRGRGVPLGRPITTSAAAEALISSMWAAGAGLRPIAKELNRLEVPTAQGGGSWHASTVRAVIARIGTKESA
jgi:DNA invertase Pin-like site-specific DNA recombinase